MSQQPHDASSPSLKRAARPFLRPVDNVSGTPTSAAPMPRPVPRPFISPAPAASRPSASPQSLSAAGKHTPHAALAPVESNPVESNPVDDVARMDPSDEHPGGDLIAGSSQARRGPTEQNVPSHAASRMLGHGRCSHTRVPARDSVPRAAAKAPRGRRDDGTPNRNDRRGRVPGRASLRCPNRRP